MPLVTVRLIGPFPPLRRNTHPQAGFPATLQGGGQTTSWFTQLPGDGERVAGLGIPYLRTLSIRASLLRVGRSTEAWLLFPLWQSRLAPLQLKHQVVPAATSYRVTESFGLQETFKIIKSSRFPSTAKW